MNSDLDNTPIDRGIGGAKHYQILLNKSSQNPNIALT
jgi:hypothetical protein